MILFHLSSEVERCLFMYARYNPEGEMFRVYTKFKRVVKHALSND